MSIKYNPEQEAFINRITLDCGLKLKHNNRSGMVVLNAPAGTGKTTIIKKLYKDCSHTTILAPTHKAVQVLDPSGAMHVSTVHSYLGAVDHYTENGKVYFKFIRPKKATRRLIIVDECSMINDDMFKAFEMLSQHNLVLFVGDELQLPPNSNSLNDDSSVSSKSKSFDVKERWSLTQNMRARDKRSTDMLQLARDACYEKRMPIRMPQQSVNAMLQTFVDYQHTDKTVILLAYSNAKVAQYNKVIRSKLFLKDPTEELQRYYVGEKLVFGSGRRVVRNAENKEVAYYSSHIVQVCELERVIMTLDFPDCGCAPDQWKRTKCAKHGFYKGSIDIEFYHIVDQHGTDWFKPVDPKRLEPLQAQKKSMCKDTTSQIMWRNYYNWLHEWNADLKYNYAMTIHKSQGSEFHTVFVHRENLEQCTTKDQVLKVTGYYTAISRMREEVYDLARD